MLLQIRIGVLLIEDLFGGFTDLETDIANGLPGNLCSGTTARPRVRVANRFAERCPETRDSEISSFATSHSFLEERLRDQCPKSKGRRANRIFARAKVDLMCTENFLPLVVVEDFGQGEFIRLQHAVFN